MYCKHGKPYIRSTKGEDEEHLFLLELVIESIITEQSLDRCCGNEREPLWTAAFWLMDTFSFEIKQDEDAQPEETVFRDLKLRRVKFNAGKSCLFLARPYKFLSIIQQHPIYVSVQTEPEDSIVPDILGRGKIPFDPAMIYDVKESIDNKTTNVECSRAGCYPLYDCVENEVGHIKCFLRLSYYGRNILSEFKLTGGMDDLIFKVDKGGEKNRCRKCGNRLKSVDKGSSSTYERKDPTDYTRQNFPEDLDDRGVKRDSSWKKVYSCSSKTSPCNKRCSSHHFHEFLLLAKGSEQSETSKPSSTYESLKRMAAHLDLEEFITEIGEDPADIYEKPSADENEAYREELPVTEKDVPQCTCEEKLVDTFPPGGVSNEGEKLFVDEETDCLGLGEVMPAYEDAPIADEIVSEEPIPSPPYEEKRSPVDSNNLRMELEEDKGPSTSASAGYQAPAAPLDIQREQGRRQAKGKGSGRISGRGPNKTRDPDLGMRRPPKPQAGPSRNKRLSITSEAKSGHGCPAHSECQHPYKKVPKGMGWLWTENHDLGRGWKPGTVSSSVVKMMEVQRSNFGGDRGDFLPKGKEVPKSGKIFEKIPDGLGPALRFRMHKGSYFISLDPSVSGGKPKDRKDQNGFFVRINKKVNEELYSSSSDLEFEFIAPSEKKDNADINKKAMSFNLGTVKNPPEHTITPPSDNTKVSKSPKVARTESQKPSIPWQNRARGNVEKEPALESKETQVGGKDFETTVLTKKEKPGKLGRKSDQEPVEKSPEEETPMKVKKPKKNK